jgi:23S rRNA A2030 N6-methylase RlmJ
MTRRSVPFSLARALGVSCYRAILIDPNVRARTYRGIVHLLTTDRRLACGFTASWYPATSRPPVTCRQCLRRPEARE